jgi:hypothetical protein
MNLVSLVVLAAGDETSGVAKLSDLEGVFGNVVQAVLGFAGIALLFMLVAGGFKFITAGGDPKAVESAKQTLTYAILGIVFVASALLILRLIEQFTGAPVTEFKIGQ